VVRPNSIVWFERLYLGAWLVGLISLGVNWGTTQAALEPATKMLGSGAITNMVIAGVAIGALITFVLWYFVARQGAVVAKWIVVVLFVLSLLGIPGTIRMFSNGQALRGLFQVVVFLMQAGAVVMLFRPDSRVWFGEIRDEPPANDIFS